VPRWVKVVIWIGVFSLCAGAGAFVAAHTNPFPPGVEDPGARPTSPAPTSPAATNERWNLVMESATRHELHVGGSCRSGWRTTGFITVRPDGTAGGEAHAALGGWGCDFPVAQVQTRTVELVITGARSGDRLVLHLSEAGSQPEGSQDLGGFTATLRRLVPKVALGSGHGAARVKASRPDGDLGRYVNDSTIQLNCATGC
jgi:hypothetical protein